MKNSLIKLGIIISPTLTFYITVMLYAVIEKNILHLGTYALLIGLIIVPVVTIPLITIIGFISSKLTRHKSNAEKLSYSGYLIPSVIIIICWLYFLIFLFK